MADQPEQAGGGGGIGVGPAGEKTSADPSSLSFLYPRPAEEVFEQRVRVPEELRGHVMVTPIDSLVAWAQKNSIWPVSFGLACCAIEYMAFQNSRFDASRFGWEVNRASPRQADIMIVS